MVSGAHASAATILDAGRHLLETRAAEDSVVSGYVAIKDWSGHDELGDPLTIKAGITHCSQNWSTLRDPDIRALFAPEGSREMRNVLRTRSSAVLPARTPAAGKPAPVTPVRVYMTDVAYKRLLNQPFGRGHEVGGTLFGYVDGREVVIRDGKPSTPPRPAGNASGTSIPTSFTRARSLSRHGTTRRSGKRISGRTLAPMWA